MSIRGLAKNPRKWINASYNPVFDAEGRPYKVVKYAVDITDQVKTRETAKTLSLVANETDNSVIICDKFGKIEYINPGFTKLTGYVLEDCIGKKPGELLQGKHTDEETKKRIREKLDLKQPFYDEIINYNKAGESYWISLAINPVFDNNGELDKYISIQTNITETKLQQLDFNCKLEAISKASALLNSSQTVRLSTPTITSSKRWVTSAKKSKESITACSQNLVTLSRWSIKPSGSS